MITKSKIILSITFIFLTSTTHALECNEEFEEIYLAQKSCFLNNEQDSCDQLSELYGLGAIATGAGTGAVFAKLSNEFKLKKSTDFPEHRTANRRLLPILRDLKKAGELYSKFETKAIETITDGKAHTMEDFRQYTYRMNARERDDIYARLRKSITNQIVSESRSNTNLRTALNEMHNSNRPSQLGESIKNIFRKQFPTDYRYVEELLKKHSGEIPEAVIKKLNPNQQNMVRTLEAYDELKMNKKTFLLDDAIKGRQQLAHTEKTKVPLRSMKKSALKGGALAAVAMALGDAVSWAGNSLHKGYVESCKDDLGLNGKDLKILNQKGLSYVLSPPRASTNSVLDPSKKCSKVHLNDAAQVIAESKFTHGGKISAGICNIMQNEVKQFDDVFKELLSLRNVSCEGFKAANLEVKGDGFKKTMIYQLANGAEARIPFDGQEGWPDYTQAEVFSKGVPSSSMTNSFRDRHQRYTPADLGRDNPNPRWDLKELTGCLDVKETSENCKLQRAALATRVYYSQFKANCSQEVLEKRGEEKSRKQGDS
ncbi:MAG: hypothetical protein KDD50_04250 [Bdellovibrionales bacterium]|nr:hypothetical protein [Bdellovibrionales bacterium]